MLGGYGKDEYINHMVLDCVFFSKHLDMCYTLAEDLFCSFD